MNKEYKSIKEMLYDVVSIYGEKTAFVGVKEDNHLFNKSYKNLLEEINYLGTGLDNLRLNQGKTIIIGKNSYEWALSFLTCICGNGITVPLDKELSDVELVRCVNRIDANTIIYSQELENRLMKLKEQMCIKNYISMQKNENLNIYDIMEDGKKELEIGNKNYIDIQIDEHRVTELLFTSGTTTDSKIVMLSNYNIISNVVNAKKMIHIDENDTFLSLLPLHHTFENTCGLITPLCSGATISYNDSLKNIILNMKRMQPTIILVVPRFMEIFYNKIQKELEVKKKKKLVNNIATIGSFFKYRNQLKRKIFHEVHEQFGSKLRLFIIGGAAANPTISKFMRGIGFSVLQGYGLTECSPMVAVNEDKDFEDEAVGKAVIGTDIKIHKPDEYGIGEVKVKGPQVMKGYYHDEQATYEVIREDGFFYTGDLGYFDRKKFLRLVGRTKNLIISSNGKNIYPEEIERIINGHDLIQESMVYQVENDTNKLRLIVDIVLCDELQKKIKENNQYKTEIIKVIGDYITEVNSKLPDYKKIMDFNIKSEEFEKTTTLKIKRYTKKK